MRIDPDAKIDDRHTNNDEPEEPPKAFLDKCSSDKAHVGKFMKHLD